MKECYAIIYAVLAVCLIFCMVRSCKKERERPIARPVRQVLLWILFGVVANILLLTLRNEMALKVLYSIYFVSTDYVLYYAFIFSMEFSRYQIKNRQLLHVIWAVLFLDSISMLANVIYGHAFGYEYRMLHDGTQHLTYVSYPFHQLHLAISYLLIIAILGVLIHKVCKTTRVYQFKYIWTLVILACIIVGYALNYVKGLIIDTTAISLALGVMALYFFSVEYVSNELLNRTLVLVAQEMSEGVILFDADNKCIYTNSSARVILEKGGDTIETVEQTACNWIMRNRNNGTNNERYEFSKMIGGQMRHLRIRFHYMEDERKRYMGSFITILDRTQEVEDLQRAQYEATHDFLTGLYNREYFEKCAREWMDAEPDETFLIVCSDVKNFKLINDIYGAETGNVLLCNIADALRKFVWTDPIYGRIGGDKFAMMLRKKYFREELFSEAPRTVEHVEGDNSYPVQIHVGIYEVTERDLPISVMCDRAFMAIKTIKDSYDKKVAYYDDALRSNILTEQEMSSELDFAMSDHQFMIYLQPQISASGEVHGAEALVRWRHPKKGMIMPGLFITAFEKNGLIAKLDRHVWEMACMKLREWKEQGRDDMYISVNISPKDIYFIDVYQTIVSLVEKYGIDKKNLKLEITETAVAKNPEEQLALIEKLRNYGFIVEMDDFGSGYSSLNMLKDIIVDILKIDMKFLGTTKEEQRSREILKKIVELSSSLGMPVIVEGVETCEQVEFLKDIGCNMFQGYYFAKPMEVEQFEDRYM